MKARDVMTTDPACATPNDAARDVAQLMVQNDCGAVPIVSEEGTPRVIGIVSDRDITIRGTARGKGPETPVYELMSTDVQSCSAGASLQQVERIMADRQVRRVVVVDDDERCVGIIAQADLVRATERTADLTNAEVVRVIEEISEPSVGGDAFLRRADAPVGP